MVDLQSPSGWGTARDPKTDERVALDGDVEPGVARRLAERYDRIDIDGDLPEDVGETTADIDDGDGTLPFDPSSKKIGELEEELADVGSEAALAALRSAEEGEKDRKGAKAAIDDRLDAVREE